MPLSTRDLFVTLSISSKRHYAGSHYAEGHYAEGRYAECRDAVTACVLLANIGLGLK